MRSSLTVAVAALFGCGGDATSAVDSGSSSVDAPPADASAPSADAAPCVPAPDPTWLEDYQRDVIARLAGAAEITPGVTITQRASAMNRAIARDWIFAELERLGYAPARHDYDANGANVYARLGATRGGGGLLVLGAHFDGVPVGPAAADDGTGVAIVLAAARHLRAETCRAHDVIFVLFDQEEVGLLGSTFFAEKLVVDGEDVRGVQVFDMISFDGDGDRAIELWNADPALEARWRDAAGATHPIRSVAFDASDHAPFEDRGFPTVGVCEEFVSGDATPHYHTAMDSYDKIDFAYLGDVTRVAFAVTATLLSE